MVWPGESDVSYPDVFTKPPTGRYESGPLTTDQLTRFYEDGFVMVDLLTPEELEPVKRDIELRVERLAEKLLKAGRITETFQEADVSKRLILLNDAFPGANVLMHKGGIMSESFKALWSNTKLLDIAEQILGTPEIAGHPVWNLRTQTPNNSQTTVPWHQDSAYLDHDSYGIMQLTAWIPLLDTDTNTGCLQMVRGGHRKGKVASHTCCHDDTWYITLTDDEMRKTLDIDTEKDVVTCPVPYGSVLFFSNLIPHRSLNNQSDGVRWSMDLRWQRSDKPVGFYGLKHGVQLQSAAPDFTIDWGDFNTVDRVKKGDETCRGDEVDEFDTTLCGPWMNNWEMVNENKHTRKFKTTQSLHYH